MKEAEVGPASWLDGNPLQRLRSEVTQNRVALVVGAGASQAVAGLPGWKQAVKSAIQHLERSEISGKEQIDSLQEQLSTANSTSDLISCASSARRLLTGSAQDSGEFGLWLENTFGTPSVRDLALLRAIHNFPASLITTTNYDKMLSTFLPGLESCTWTQPSELAFALRRGDRIIHLHGIWDVPESVVFGSSDYRSIRNSDAYNAMLRTLWLDRTLLFIGCSFDGLRDPDLALLLDWAATTFPDSTIRHFALVRAGSYTAEQAEKFLTQWRIQLIPYGDDYSDLVPFLQSLTPGAPSRAPLPPRVFKGRENELRVLTANVLSRQWTLVHGMGGIGKSALLAALVAAVQRDFPQEELLWTEQPIGQLPELCREVGRQLEIPGIGLITDQEIPFKLRYALSVRRGVTIVVNDAADLDVVREFATLCLPANIALAVASRVRSPGFTKYVEVGPLDIPSADQLFWEIAQVAPELPIVRQITSLLEEHPLAIVLAGGRHAAEAMPLRSLYSRLAEEKHRLDALKEPGQPESASTSVRASLAISLEGLPSDLTEVLATLAYFFTDTSISLLAAALDVDIVECEDLVGRLAQRSLVSRNQADSVHLHQLVRTAARERYRERADLYNAMVERAFMSMFVGLNDSTNLQPRMLVDNLENALALVAETTSLHSEVRKHLAVGLITELMRPHGVSHRYLLRVQRREAIEGLIDLAFGLAESFGDPTVQIELIKCKAELLIIQREPGQALDVLGRAQQIAIDHGLSRSVLASIKCEFGNCLLQLHDYRQAENAMRSGLRDAMEAGDPSGIAQLTGQLALVLKTSGDLEAAKQYYLDAKSLYAELGGNMGVAACAAHLASIAERQGRNEECWLLHCESLRADLDADNFLGAMNSLEEVANRVANQEQLQYVEGAIEEIAANLPFSTAQEVGRSLSGLRAVALMQVNRFSDAEDLLLASLESPDLDDDSRGRAVTLGRLSLLSMMRGDYESALKYNTESREAYALVADVHGVITCHHNGVSFAAELGRLDEAVYEACEGIQLSALAGDLKATIKTFYSLVTLVVPRLSESPNVLFPADQLEYRQLMGLIAGTAEAREVGRLIGTVHVLLAKFGSAGTLDSRGAKEHGNSTSITPSWRPGLGR